MKKTQTEIEDLALDIVKQHLDDLTPTDIYDQVYDAWGLHSGEKDTQAVKEAVDSYTKQLRGAMEIWGIHLKQKREYTAKLRKVLEDLKVLK